MRWLATAADGMEALRQARLLHPDLILMDIDMPGCDGLAATRLIKAEMPQVKIVMLTVSASDEHLLEAVKSGASGYLLKSQSADRFLEMVADVARGGAALPPDLAARLLEAFAHQAQPVEAAGGRPSERPDGAPGADPDAARPGPDLPADRRGALPQRSDRPLPPGPDPGPAAPGKPRPGHRLRRPPRAVKAAGASGHAGTRGHGDVARRQPPRHCPPDPENRHQ